MAIKILVTGDIHLGRRSGSIDNSSLYGSIRYIWEEIVSRAIESSIDIVALTGDVVDRDNRYFEAIGPLQEGFEKLENAGIQVVVIAGNHDFDVLPELLDARHFSNVVLLGRGQRWETQTLIVRGKPVIFTGWSFASRHVGEDPLLSFDLEINEPEIPVIGMIHGDVDIPLSRYAPMSRAGFRHKGVDVWLLGHIHQRSILMDRPLVLYPGSPQALDAGEKGEHGPVLLTIDHKESIRHESFSWSPVRYENIEMDVTGISPDHLRGELIENLRRKTESLDTEHQRELLYDVDLIGECQDISMVEERLRQAEEAEFSVEECRVRIRKINVSRLQVKIQNLEELARQKSPVGMIAEVMMAIKEEKENEFLQKLRFQLKKIHQEIRRRGTFNDIEAARSEATDEFVDEILWQQCNQLLSELIGQKENV